MLHDAKRLSLLFSLLTVLFLFFGSCDVYQNKSLKTKEYPKAAKQGFQTPTQTIFSNKKKVFLSNQTYNLFWDKPGEKYENSFIVIRDCDEVVIDGINIFQNNFDYLATYSILIEDCKKVVVKNSAFMGTCLYHLRIEGCEEVLIDNVRISGLDYGGKGVRCGGGIWINNGVQGADNGKLLWSKNPKNLQQLTIRNCLIQNNLTTDKERNSDGILIHSASNGTLTDCIFENWLAGDAALDVSHRRVDEAYTNKHFLIERNIFKNNKHVKTVGGSNASNSIVWINNLYSDTMIGSYHQGWSVKRFYESFLFSNSTFGFWRNWSGLDGPVEIKGCLLHVKRGFITEMFKLSDKNAPAAHERILTDSNIYSMPKEPTFWLRHYATRDNKSISEIVDWPSWRQNGRDENSLLLIDSGDVVVRQWKDMEYPVYLGSAAARSSPAAEYAPQDFFGKIRGNACYGAVCPQPASQE